VVKIAFIEQVTMADISEGQEQVEEVEISDAPPQQGPGYCHFEWSEPQRASPFLRSDYINQA
jgi:hypothetical protein